MSSYLLLRDNKESGPFNIDEVRRMALKPYDLIWVTGKSIAWKYPGEIYELKAFAPPTPDTAVSDQKKVKSDALKTDPKGAIQSSRSVYVNHPAVKKDRIQTPVTAPAVQSVLTDFGEQKYDFSDLYNRKKVGWSVQFSSKILWISTILFLFSAGLVTGFFISDRRKFYSSNGEPSPDGKLVLELKNKQKEVPPVADFKNVIGDSSGMNPLMTDSGQDTFNRDLKKSSLITASSKKKLKTLRKDSSTTLASDPVIPLKTDSLRQNTATNTESLFQKIKTHPENYIDLVTGRFNTGMFGGISSFPVTVTNNSPVMMNLVTVNIDYIQNNQKIYKTESISFSDLEPGESVTIKAPKSARGIKIATRIKVVNSRQLDLSYSN